MKMFFLWSFSKRVLLSKQSKSSIKTCWITQDTGHDHTARISVLSDWNLCCNPPLASEPVCEALSLPVWCRRRWTPRSRPPRWLSAGTAGILRCCHRRSFPTWRPWRCWWSCRRSGWCQTPPLQRLCQQFPDKKQRGTVRSWFMTLDGNSTLIGRAMWRLARLKDDYVLLIFSFIFLSTNSVWGMKNQQWIDPDT